MSWPTRKSWNARSGHSPRNWTGLPPPLTPHRRKRPIFYAALKYAVKRKYLAVNPLADEDIDFTAPRAVEAVDPRTEPHPRQAKALLAATRQVKPVGTGNRVIHA